MTYVERVEHHCKGLSFVSESVSPQCPFCRGMWGLTEAEMTALEESDNLIDEGGPSRADCDTCGFSVYGNRFCAHGFDEAGDMHHLVMCEDCVVYFANGDIPTGENA